MSLKDILNPFETSLNLKVFFQNCELHEAISSQYQLFESVVAPRDKSKTRTTIWNVRNHDTEWLFWEEIIFGLNKLPIALTQKPTSKGWSVQASVHCRHSSNYLVMALQARQALHQQPRQRSPSLRNKLTGALEIYGRPFLFWLLED